MLSSAELDAFRQQPGVTIGVLVSGDIEWTGSISSGTAGIRINDGGNYIEAACTNAAPFRRLTVPSIAT